MSFMERMFGKKAPPPEEQVDNWTRNIRSEQRKLDRQIREIEREERKVEATVKKYAKSGEVANARILAKQLASSRKAKNRIRVSKAMMESMKMEIKQQARMVKLNKVFGKSASIMKSMNNLVDVQMVSETMRTLEHEMMKAGVIDDVVSERMDAMDPADLDEAADLEVEKVLYEITAGEMGALPEEGHGELVSELQDTASEEQMEAFITQMKAARV
eukprot:CAMPEP_0182948562 /NCGR_PEP_ID=MMETSP0105_2-20130417/59821_1 /TAXON_ID=81532 ORGANISM="Acanthoeca-like sp., Strain 10tr" /NCGR_SAMPLE_ID=MMETSP0105_2 /ASSEMBLY_ACC=CAM_ASM_000205 /LENGTH=215 /DNA_ID=CAMNT_0025088855 /DNA_START=43 /DNA_END=690 /DNA_ORIENTATION=+